MNKWINLVGLMLFEQIDQPGIYGYSNKWINLEYGYLNKWINLGYMAIEQVDQPGIYGYFIKWINLGYVAI